MNAIVATVHTPTVFKESRAASAAPVLTSEAMSSIFNVASKPGIGRGSSTSQTLLKIMKYITPRKPANMDAIIPMKASCSVSTEDIRKPSPTRYESEYARRNMAGKVKMKPVEACVAPVVALVAILTSEGDHFRAIPSKYATYHAAETAIPIFNPIYAVTPLKRAPMSTPIRTFLVFQWLISNDSSRFFSSRYCSSTPVLRLLYMSSSSHVRVPFSMASKPEAVTGCL